jgi:MFS superfamily sulfate permease-like transporter
MRAWVDMTLMSLTFILTIIWSVQVGVTVSLIISLLLVVRRSSRTRMTILVRHLTDRVKHLFKLRYVGVLGSYTRNG